MFLLILGPLLMFLSILGSLHFMRSHQALWGLMPLKEEVIKLLTEVDDVSLQELKVVSIVGFGGLGKTSLANEVYRSLSESFSCKAIISVSQRPDMMSLLTSLFSKVSGHGDDRSYDLLGLIDNLREYLQGKRYLVVVDDLWDASAWDVIKCAFPESRCSSRVLTTTRIESVAIASCSYKWKFKVVPSKNFCLGNQCPETFEELCVKILQKCGGLPLEIITIASLLASQPTMSIEQWSLITPQFGITSNIGRDEADIEP
ncbi:hypothetical protein U9M48_005339 [Paspalum notatum var. saurae]|uniref:NB-ARC domain-containing protein n=1 Tax=Paspalum notatum var. saurae TaxID=547442 RepID=A0AAQ3SLS7_PASNO